MGKIVRNPEQFSKKTYDLIVIGGGIYGIMISMEAARRHFRCLLLEKGDFGGATTFNSLRILHGGFRYLQSLDLHRFLESVNERRWFLRYLPELVIPLACLMPLYGKGMRRPSVLRVASGMNNVLSCGRNRGVFRDKHLPKGKVISAEETLRLAPGISAAGIKGGVLWYDASMQDSQRIVVEILREACGTGAEVLNYMEALELITNRKKVLGVKAKDLETGRSYEYRARIVVNAAGPWCREVARRFDRDVEGLFKGSLAWNVLLSKPAFSACALAVSPKKNNGKTYFLVPWKGKVLAGTGHVPWEGTAEDPRPSPELLQDFLDDLNLAIPGLEATKQDILYLFSGLLPATVEGTSQLAVREVIWKHSEHDGPEGLYSLSGVKFTTARKVAEKALNKIFGLPSRKNPFKPLTIRVPSSAISGPKGDNAFEAGHLLDSLGSIVRDESVVHLDDLVFRRTSLWEKPQVIRDLAPTLCSLFPWDPIRRNAEMARIIREIPKGEMNG